MLNLQEITDLWLPAMADLLMLLQALLRQLQLFNQ